MYKLTYKLVNGNTYHIYRASLEYVLRSVEQLLKGGQTTSIKIKTPKGE